MHSQKGFGAVGIIGYGIYWNHSSFQIQGGELHVSKFEWWWPMIQNVASGFGSYFFAI